MEKKSCDKCIRWICAALFGAFAFCWLFFFQRELLQAENSVLFSADNGLRIWMFNHHFVVSLALTLIALLLAIPGRIVLRFKKGLYACNYLLSAAFLGIIAGYDGESVFGQNLTVWIASGSFMFVLFLICKIVASVPKSEYNDRPRTLAGNLLILSLLFAITSYLGNTDENLHRRLRMEQLYNRGEYARLLDYGRYEEESDPGIDLLRAKALLQLPSNDNPAGSQIGENLFKYTVSDPKALSKALKGTRLEQAYLASCLLDGNLKEFADTINLNAYNTLPKYYMQAMVILNDSTARVKFPNQFAEELSSYNSFRKTLESLKSESRQFQSNSTFISNHESYFWFYTFRR